MALRVKNISQGFYDATGFHPIRKSGDYDPDRAGDDYSETGRKRKKRKTKAKAKTGAKRKTKAAKSRRKAAPRKKARKTVGKVARRKTAKKVSRSKNPIPLGRWTRSKVKRTPSGDIKVLLY